MMKSAASLKDDDEEEEDEQMSDTQEGKTSARGLNVYFFSDQLQSR